jgi:phosphoribosylformylglycinamidine synthase
MLKPDISDAFGNKTRDRIAKNLNLPVDSVRTSDMYAIDKELPKDQVDVLCKELFTDPVIQTYKIDEGVSSEDFDWLLEIGYSPGSNDTEGNTIQSAIENITGIDFLPDEKIYTSKRYMIKAKEGETLTRDDIENIAKERR